MNAADLIKRHEGCELRAYQDTLGNWTCGWGCTGPDINAETVWTEQQAEAEFEKRFSQARMAAMDVLGADDWIALDDAREAVLIDMAYQLGKKGLAGFHHMLAALRDGDWLDAAAELRLSHLNEQTPNRVAENARILETGAWPE